MLREAQFTEGVRARVSPDMLADLLRRAKELDSPLSDVVRLALADYLDRKPEGLVRGKVFA
jgi:hypothetical protein